MPDINFSDAPNSSAIKSSKLNNFLSSLFGWRRTPRTQNTIEFTKVDIASDQKIGQALADLNISTSPMSERLEKLFNNWMQDTTDKYSEIQDRKNRVDQISYAVLNEPILSRVVDMYADEACQLNEQDAIINVETPDPRMTRDMYKLLSQWGITPTRIHATIKQMAAYGDAFWANKISERGVERVIPLTQLQVSSRLEFNPVHALEIFKRQSGALNSFANKNYLIDKMLSSLEDTSDFADMFDTKLFGFSIEDDLVVPPWSITHFRVGADSSQFYPFGTSPIIGAIAPFKQVQSTIALQSLARMMSFPVQVYKVKTSENMDEGRQFGVVNRVREAYDNIGIVAKEGTSEVYTVNTKIWIPDGLLSVETVKSDAPTDNVEDLKIYQEREAIAAGLPKSFFAGEGEDASGKSLIQQYKPFARKVYSVQSAFLESLADLFRIHFAITGQYDFRVPFTISMRYPAVETGEEVQSARSKSMELSKDIISLVKSVVGAGDDESLPPDIVRDIVGKYSFINPSDLMKWTRDAKYSLMASEAEDEALEGSSDDYDTYSDSDIDIAVEESITIAKSRLRERKLTEAYMSNRDSIYFKILESFSVNDFNRDGYHVHVCNNNNSSIDLMLETLNAEYAKPSDNRLQESTEENILGPALSFEEIKSLSEEE